MTRKHRRLLIATEFSEMIEATAATAVNSRPGSGTI